jgi:hypothetical protein
MKRILPNVYEDLPRKRQNTAAVNPFGSYYMKADIKKADIKNAVVIKSTRLAAYTPRSCVQPHCSQLRTHVVVCLEKMPQNRICGPPC